MRSDAELVLAARSGASDAFGDLVTRWTDRCWEIAWRILHDRALAADVAQDALLTAWQQLHRLQEPEAFGGWVSRIARNRALDRLAQERRAMPTGDADALEQAVTQQPGAVAQADPADELERAERSQVLWAAAAALGPRDASLLDLHLRHGLEPGELAGELGVTPNAAHQAMFRLRRRLGTAIRAWLLWRHGEPDCRSLREAVEDAGWLRFGTEVVDLVEAHRATCLDCERSGEAMVAPVGMFSAVPLVAMPAALRTQVLVGLRAEGVPVSSSGSFPGPQATPTESPTASDREPRTEGPTYPSTPQGGGRPRTPLAGAGHGDEARPDVIVSEGGSVLADEDEPATTGNGHGSGVVPLLLSVVLVVVVGWWLLNGWTPTAVSVPASAWGKDLVIADGWPDGGSLPAAQLVVPLPAVPGGEVHPEIFSVPPADPSLGGDDEELAPELEDPAAAPAGDDVAPGAPDTGTQQPDAAPRQDDPTSHTDEAEERRDVTGSEDPPPGDVTSEGEGQADEAEPDPVPSIVRFSAMMVDRSLCPDPSPRLIAYRFVLVSSGATSAQVTFLVPEGSRHDLPPNTGDDGAVVCVPLVAEHVLLELIGPGGISSVEATVG